MKFNYQKEEEDDSDQEFLESSISTSFTFDRSERGQLRSLRKWFSDIGINHTVTKFKNDEGNKMYCLVAYEEPEFEEEVEELVELPKTKTKKSKKKADKAEKTEKLEKLVEKNAGFE